MTQWSKKLGILTDGAFTEGVFCTVYDNAGKTELSKGLQTIFHRQLSFNLELNDGIYLLICILRLNL